MDIVDKIMAYESGELNGADTVEFFAELVKTGTVWTLQGSYGRMATALINGGYLDSEGNILATITED